MFDFHRHINQSEYNKNAIYCTSSTDEWNNTNPISLGLLFNNNNYTKKTLDPIINLLKIKLENNKSYQIGEIGLDKRYNQIELQYYFLDECIKLSNQYNRVLTIHCVKSYDLLFSLLENNKGIMGPLTILHGFTSSLEIAKKLKSFDVIISINNNFLKTKAFKDITDFDKLGFLIESDWNKQNDDNYLAYFNKFVSTLDDMEISKFKELNHEYRTIFENISSYR